jgi:hypothetical protein
MFLAVVLMLQRLRLELLEPLLRMLAHFFQASPDPIQRCFDLKSVHLVHSTMLWLVL